jgi:hypothetical protein
MTRKSLTCSALALAVIVGGYMVLRATVLKVDLDTARLVGLTSTQVVDRVGRPDMIVPRAEKGEVDWIYNKAVMGEGRRVRLRNDRVVSVTRDEGL